MQEEIGAYIKRYKWEIVMCVASIGCVIALAIGIYTYDQHIRDFVNTRVQAQEQPTPEPMPTKQPAPMIIIDISGGVVRPGTYELKEGARLFEALKKAGGLSVLADRDFYARNFNASKRLTDQEKIYIPRTDEVENGTFLEAKYCVDQMPEQGAQEQSLEGSGLISVNTGSKDELDSLPGIGPATVEKIIAGRPYESLEELLQEKIVGEKTFEQIKDLISL